MKVAVNTFLVNPSKSHPSLIEKVGIGEGIIKDVASFEFTENELHLHLNNGSEQTILLRDNDGTSSTDWRGVSIFVTRKFLEVDMSK